MTGADKRNLCPGLIVITNDGREGSLIGPKMDDNFWTIEFYNRKLPPDIETLHISNFTYRS